MTGVRRHPRLRRDASVALLVLGVLAISVPPPAGGQTIVLQNDSVVDFGQVAVLPGFAADERAAAWLTSPCAGELTHVRILWLSVPGNHPTCSTKQLMSMRLALFRHQALGCANCWAPSCRTVDSTSLLSPRRFPSPRIRP